MTSPPETLYASEDLALRAVLAQLAQHAYHFTTVTPATHERVRARTAKRWAKNLSDVFGWSCHFEPAMLPPGMFEAMQMARIAVQEEQGWKSTVRVSTLNGIYFLHSAYPTLANDAVFFGPDTYRYVAAIEKHLQTSAHHIRRVVDIGCGAGPGAITIARQLPDAEVLAVDINDTALAYTRLNADNAGAINVIAKHSNLLHDVEGHFDLIVANPPYLLDPKQRAYRHGGGELGAGLSLDIVEAAGQRLADGGTLVLYTGAAIVAGIDPFLNTASARLNELGLHWSYREVDPDVFGEELAYPAYAHADRIAAVVLSATRPRH